MIERYKCIEDPWPWKDENNTSWNKLWWRTLALYSLNMLVIVPLTYSPFYYFDLPLDVNVTMEGLPDPITLLSQIFFSMLLEDLTFYFSHRMLH